MTDSIHTAPYEYSRSPKALHTLVSRALARKDVLLAFQPIVQAQHPNRPAFHEGLLRVLDDNGRVVPAAVFFPALEHSRMGRTLDCAALQLGLAELAAQPDLRLSINVSPLSLGSPHWHRTLDDGLAQDPTIAERLILEITEAATLPLNPEMLRIINHIQQLGIALALDDFGAGATGLAQIGAIRFDILKIDRQFIQNVPHDPNNQAILRALLSIGRHFDMFTVAEGVEYPDELAYLEDAGVDGLQGYGIAMPTTAPHWRSADKKRRIAG